MWKTISKLNFRSLYLNLKPFPFSMAVRLPILVSSRVMIRSLKGKIQVEGPVTPGMIQIGYGSVGIFDYKRSRSVIGIEGEWVIKGKTRIGHGSKIVVGKNGRLETGHNFMINAESGIIANKSIKFGNDILISWDVLLMDDDFHEIIDIAENARINYPGEITVGDKVWIGARALILKNTSIAGNSIIAAGSILSGKFQGNNVVYGGNPIRILREGVSWKL